MWSTGNPRVKTLFAVNNVKRGVCKWENADGKMRKDAKKSKKNKTRNADGKNK